MVASSRQEPGTAGERAHMYSEVGQNDDHGDEKELPSLPTEDYRALEQRLQNLKIWLYSLIVLLIFTFVFLLISLGSSSKTRKAVSDMPMPVPAMPIKPVTFRQYDVFANHSNPKSNDAWAGLMPPGDGFVLVQNPEKYNLQPGKNSTQGPLYDISVFHQLHCLKHIRVFLYTVLELAQKGLETEGAVKFVNTPDEHVFHCFDYIRQALMCNADMTVEWPRVEEDGSRFAVDGWGIDHQCKDWDSVMQWMEDNRFHQPWEQDS